MPGVQGAVAHAGAVSPVVQVKERSPRKNPMTRRTLGLLTALVATAAAHWVSTSSVSTQERPTSAPAANTAAQTWSLPRTPDGQPDIQGMWNPGDWGRPLETPAPEPKAT